METDQEMQLKRRRLNFDIETKIINFQNISGVTSSGKSRSLFLDTCESDSSFSNPKINTYKFIVPKTYNHKNQPIINSNNDQNLIGITIGEPDSLGNVIVKLNPSQVRLLKFEQIKFDAPIGRVSELEWKMPLIDIHLVADQSNASYERAALSYISNEYDLVNAIMDLTI